MFYPELDPVYLCSVANLIRGHPELDLLAGRRGSDQERKVLVKPHLSWDDSVPRPGAADLEQSALIDPRSGSPQRGDWHGAHLLGKSRGG